MPKIFPLIEDPTNHYFKDNKTDMDPEEYQEMKSETIEQLKEFETSLEKLNNG